MSDETLIKVYEAPNHMLSSYIKWGLEDQGIPTLETIDHSFYAGDDIFNISTGRYSHLSVSASRAREAREIIAELLAAYRAEDKKEG